MWETSFPVTAAPHPAYIGPEQAAQQTANLAIDAAITFMWSPSVSALTWLVREKEEHYLPSPFRRGRENSPQDCDS